MSRLPLIPPRKAIRAFEKAGWIVRRQVGSHVTLDKEGERNVLTIPLHKHIGRGLLRALIRLAGMTVAEFRELID